MKWMTIGMIASATLLSLHPAAEVEAQQSKMSFFITSTGSGKGADFGGIEGADKH